jgi:hypothetical protein
MRKNPLNKGIIMENAAGIGTVTSEMIEARARELAAINGRPSSEPSEADYQQAKRELTGEAEIGPQEENSESIPESDGWDPVPGSTGRQAADSLGEDEDAEGRSESAQLFEEGVRHPEQTRRTTNQSHNSGAHVPGARVAVTERKVTRVACVCDAPLQFGRASPSARA